MGDDTITAADSRISDINETIREVVETFEDDYAHIDLPVQTREVMQTLGLPAEFPFPVYRFGRHWALVKVPAKRWARLRSQYRTPDLYQPGGEEARFHLYPLTKAARSVVLYAIFPGGRGYCPGEIIVNPALPRGEENPCGLRFVEITDLDFVLMQHELAAQEFEDKPSDRFGV